jgi:hypothetical protein
MIAAGTTTTPHRIIGLVTREELCWGCGDLVATAVAVQMLAPDWDFDDRVVFFHPSCAATHLALDATAAEIRRWAQAARTRTRSDAVTARSWLDMLGLSETTPLIGKHAWDRAASSYASCHLGQPWTHQPQQVADRFDRAHSGWLAALAAAALLDITV